MSSNPNIVETAPPATSKPKRNRILGVMAAVVILAGLGYAVWYFLVGLHYESTDDAYVAGNVVQITPEISGTVVSIKADDTDTVKAGQPVVLLNQADGQVALDQAEAQLGQAVREVRTLYANNGTLDANIAAREADVLKAKAELERAEDDYKRRQALVATGAVSAEEMQHVESELANAKSLVAAAQAAAVAAREQLASNKTLTEGTTVEQHPNVMRAAARVREAYLAVARTTLLAPVSGQVAKRSVQVGQRVQPGEPLMAIVPLDNLWVDANFKEVQLRKMRVGQTVTLEADLYGSKAEYHGTVVGLSAGTGGAFSLLPAQNATGNWIKVVQRVPVRLALDPKELADHPLRIGLSMVAKVDVSDQSGPQLASAKASSSALQSEVVQAQPADADAIVSRIIAANLGTKVSAANPTASSGAALISAKEAAQPNRQVALRN
ncbi:MAG: HlyD family efflux transporter periplasmic adaptor subunit [Burkholderiaceae bacterium]|jgi:membrane fusion protein (multidrug efflux system)